jgi:DNA-binding FrmR family transcriptional regulator
MSIHTSGFSHSLSYLLPPTLSLFPSLSLSLSHFFSLTFSLTNSHLGSRVVCPRVEDDVICRMIHVNYLALQAINKATKNRMMAIMQSGLRERVQEKAREREQWAIIENSYLKERTWRKVATTISKGMRDHCADFNKTTPESIPASWVIRVDGRPTLKDTDVEEDDKEG